MATRNAPPPAGHNAKRNIAEVEADWHVLDWKDFFARGALLIEAHELCEHGEWGPWLRARKWNEEKARRAMNVSRLADKFHKLRNLPLPLTVLYDLADTYVTNEKPDPELPSIVEALAEATKDRRKRISVDEANAVIDLARQRFEYGDYPEVMLNAMDRTGKAQWAKAAIEAIKTARPTTKAEADKIVDAHHRAHVEALYAQYGPLPDWVTNDMLLTLEAVPEIKRMSMSQWLQKRTEPAADYQIYNFAHSKNEPEPNKSILGSLAPAPAPSAPAPSAPAPSAPAPAPSAPSWKTDPQQAAEKQAARNDIGADSKAEMKRLKASNAELARKLAAAEQSKKAAYRKVDEVEAKIKALEGEEPKGGIDKLADALISALRSTKVSREKAEDTLGRVCSALKIDPSKLNAEDKKAAA
jgi:hypothetical protein